MLNNTQIQGAITEQKCFLKCSEHGFIVSKPLFDNVRYDFLLDINNKIYKIQVKTCHSSKTNNGFVFNCYSQHSTGNGNKRMKYTNEEIDYFMTEFDGIFYLYPVPEQGISVKTLRTTSDNPRVKNIDYAEDYIFEKVVKDL